MGESLRSPLLHLSAAERTPLRTVPHTALHHRRPTEGGKGIRNLALWRLDSGRRRRERPSLATQHQGLVGRWEENVWRPQHSRRRSLLSREKRRGESGIWCDTPSIPPCVAAVQPEREVEDMMREKGEETSNSLERKWKGGSNPIRKWKGKEEDISEERGEREELSSSYVSGVKMAHVCFLLCSVRL